MPPDDCLEPVRRRARPPESEVSSDLLQCVGECREINPSEDEQKEVHYMLYGIGCCRAFARAAITFAHSFQEDRLVTAVMDETRIRDSRKDVEKFAPYTLLPVLIIGPKGVMNRSSARSDANTDKIIEN